MRLSLLVLSVALLSACGDDTTTEGGDLSGSCDSSFTACGGTVTGTWSVEDVCFENPGALFDEAIDQPDCKGAFGRFDVHASGSYTFGDDGSASSDINVSFDADVRLDSKCVSAIAGQSVTVTASACDGLQTQYESQPDFVSASCSFGGGACSCRLKSKESTSSSMGGFEVQGKDLIDTGDGSSNPFCVSGKTLRISQTGGGLVGTITLKQK